MSPATSSTQRQRQNGINEALGHRLVDESPDRRPVVRLRCELARSRRLGLAFDEAWDEDVTYVLATITSRDRRQWRAVLEATKPVWRAGYEREDGCSPVRLEHLLSA